MDAGTAESVIPDLLIDDHPICETQASRNGLNYISVTERRLPWSPVRQVGHRVVFGSCGSYVLNNATKDNQLVALGNGNYMLDIWVILASWSQQGTRDMTKGDARPVQRTGTGVRSIRSDGEDPGGRSGAGMAAGDEDECRVVCSRERELLGFTSNSCDSSSSSSCSDTASEIAEPRNEVTDEERHENAIDDICQPCKEETNQRQKKRKNFVQSICLADRGVL